MVWFNRHTIKTIMSYIQPVNEEYVSCCFDVPYFMERAYGVHPDPWQEELLREESQNMLLLCSRQSGKSTVSAAIALYIAAYKPGSLILIISNILRQAEETFRKVKEGFDFVCKSVGTKKDNQTMVEFNNGSRIVSLPGNASNIRSFSSVSVVVIDEAALVSDDVYNAIRPMLAVSHGSVIALTTPFGKRGWFYKAWKNEKASGVQWYRVKITADDCPRITDEFIAQERIEVGDWWVEQEYFCKFADTTSQLFSHADIMETISDEVEVLSYVM